MSRGRVAVGVTVLIIILAAAAAVAYIDATRAVSGAVGVFFASCAAATGPSPHGCPQSSSESGTDFRWALVGDPSSSLAVSFTGPQSLRAIGHYLMLETYSGTFPNGERHRLVGGPFEAAVRWSWGSATVERIASTKAPGLAAPQGVTDSALRSAVAAAFKNCTSAPPDGAPDCPQFDFAPAASNFHWTINGDPLADTSIKFDADRGVWEVLGNYSFHDSFDVASVHEEHDVNGTYFAYVIYDNSTVRAVYIRHI